MLSLRCYFDGYVQNVISHITHLRQVNSMLHHEPDHIPGMAYHNEMER